MKIENMSIPERRSLFARTWKEHRAMGGADTDQEWNQIARECGIEPPARQKPATGGGAVLVPLPPNPFDLRNAKGERIA